MNMLGRVYYKLLLMLVLVNVGCTYLPEAEFEAGEMIIEENADYIVLKSADFDDSKTGIMYYPGGLVDPHAYITSFTDLVLEDNRAVVIVKVSSNLAIVNSQKGSGLIDKIGLVKKWIVGGHSLGGSSACIDVFNNPNSFSGLFLMAAYSVSDLSAIAMPVISITGSEDKVLDQVDLDENRVNLPEGLAINSPDEMAVGSTLGSTIYYEIEGGNHAQFGNYGSQSGDGIATITPDEQQQLVTDAIRQFLLSNNL